MSNFLVRSLNLGIIDSALNWLIGALTTLLQLIIQWTIDLFVTIFAGFLYSIGLTLLSLVDFFQAFFNALCGLGTYWDSAGNAYVDQDPVLSLITNQTVLQVFLALTIVAVIMLILTTIVAMVRTEYTTEGAKNSKGSILGTALKSIAMFFIVPAACVFGILLSNGLLNAVYVATSGGDNVSAGAIVWYASSYNANKVRINDTSVTVNELEVPASSFYLEHWGSGVQDNYSKDFKLSGSVDENRETVAVMIDQAFKNRTLVITTDFKYTGTESYSFTDLMTDNTTDLGGGFNNNVYSYRNVILTELYYSVRNMNFLVMYIGGGMAIYIMFIAAFGLIIRLYKVAILFMVSAPVTAMTPLDGGAAYKSWRKLMVGSVASAFSVVLAFNLVFLLIPLMDNINIFNTTLPIAGVWNRLVNLLFVLTGLYTIKETSKWVSAMLNIEDPMAAGSEISGKVMGTVGKVGTFVGAGVAGAAMKGISGARGLKADSLALKLQAKEANGETVSQKEKNKLSTLNEKYTKSSKKAEFLSGLSTKVRKDTITKSFNRFDNFMGGANVFGGPGEDNLGGMLNAGITDAPSRLGRIQANFADRNKIKSNNASIKELNANKFDATNNIGTINGKQYNTAKEFDTAKEAEIKKLNSANDELSGNISDRKKNKDNSKLGEGYNLFAPAQLIKAQKLEDAYAEDTSAKKKMSDALNLTANNVKMDVDDLTSMKGNGKYSDLLNSSLGKEKLEKVGRSLGMTEGQVADRLDNEKLGGAKSFKDDIENQVNQYDVQIIQQGNNLNDLVGTNDTGEDIKNILQEMLNRSGMEGSSLSDIYKNAVSEIRADVRKQIEESKKEQDKIKDLAIQIAKMNKKFNPPKK